MCSHFIVGNKVFYFFKKMSLWLFGRWYFTRGRGVGGVKFSKILREVAHKEGEGGCLTDLDFFWRGA